MDQQANDSPTGSPENGPINTIKDFVQDKVVVTHIYNLRPFHYDEGVLTLLL